MIFKVGDKVKYGGQPAIIIKTYDNVRYHIKFINNFNVQGTNQLFWLDKSEIELDLEYYRNEKLNNLLNDIN